MHRTVPPPKMCLAQVSIVPRLRNPGLTSVLPAPCAREMLGAGSADAGLSHQALFLRKASCGDCIAIFSLLQRTKSQSIKDWSTPSFRLGVPPLASVPWLEVEGDGGSITSTKATFPIGIRLERNAQNMSAEDCLPKPRRGKGLCLVGRCC